MSEPTSLCDLTLGVAASVVFDSEGGPRTVNEETKRDYRDIGPGYLDDIQVVSVWTFQVALYALQNPLSHNINRALELIGASGDVDEHLDEETLRSMPVPKPDGWDRL